MKLVEFSKYQATGNDFILIDNRDGSLDDIDVPAISKLCDRRFGIGSDGLILIETDADTDFHMRFYNPDGSQSLCGNGSRCAVIFARSLGIIDNHTTFLAHDGRHEAEISGNIVRLKMKDVTNVRNLGDGMFLDTGSPHLIQFVVNIDRCNVYSEGKRIRNGGLFKKDGVNVNFVEVLDKQDIYVRTYERGVEDETLSCGTGVTAAAVAAHIKNVQSPVTIQTRGGELEVDYRKTGEKFTDIFLSGPAELVYTGEIKI